MIEFFYNISFANPEFFILLVLFPIIWVLFKDGLDNPNLKKFPAIVLIAKKKSSDISPNKSNYFSIFLKLLLFFLLVILLANPKQKDNEFNESIIILDNSWYSGTTWKSMIETVNLLIDSKKENEFTVFTTVSKDNNKLNYLYKKKGFETKEFLKDIKPQAFKPEYRSLSKEILNFVQDDKMIFWFTNHYMDDEKSEFYNLIKKKNIKVFNSKKYDFPQILTLLKQIDNNYRFSIFNPLKNETRFYIDCYDERQRLIIRKEIINKEIDYNNGNLGNFSIELPKEINNLISYFKINNTMSASGVAIKSNNVKKKDVGLIQTNYQKNENEYYRANFFIRKAIESKYKVNSLPIEQLLLENKSLIISDDFDTTFFSSQEKILQWVAEGGTFLKFAGNKFMKHASDKNLDSFLGIIPITKEVISMDGELSFEKNLSINQIYHESPFKGLKIPEKVKIRKYIGIPKLLENDINFWITLENGASIVTHNAYKKGNIIFVHLPANNEWSNISLSIFFSDLLYKIIEMSRGTDTKRVDQVFKPFKILDGYGKFIEANIDTLNLEQNSLQKIQLNYKTPAGIYKNDFGYHGLNISNFLKTQYEYSKLPKEIILNNFDKSAGLNLLKIIIILCIVTFIFETLYNFIKRSFLKFRFLNINIVLILIFFIYSPYSVFSDEKINYVEKTKIGYLETKIKEVDKISYNGLTQISKYISSKTSAVLGNPIKIDLELNEVDYFPLIYVPLIKTDRGPSFKAIKKLQNFINSGGILFFDCKATYGSLFVEDCLINFNQKFKDLDISTFRKLTLENTLSKSFYLLDNYPGRKNEMVYIAFNNQINNDKVLSVIIGNNDWTGAWAKDKKNEYSLPLFSNDKEQRILSKRFGTNIVLYSLTGSYKSDQVHIPEILKRMKN